VAASLLPLDRALAQAPLPAIEAYFRTPQTSSVELSPNGQHALALRMHQGRRNIVVVDLTSNKSTIITNFKDADVVGARWVNSSRIIFGLIDTARGLGDQVGSGLMSIKIDGSEFRNLIERSGTTEGGGLLPAGTDYLQRWSVENGETEEIVVVVPSMQARGQFSSSLYRLNVANGRSSLISLGAPSGGLDWTVDANNVPRVVVTRSGDTTKVLGRASANGDWFEIASGTGESADQLPSPIAFDKAGTLYLSGYFGKDYVGVYAYDLEKRATSKEPVAYVEGFDVQATTIMVRGELAGLRFELDRPRTLWINPAIASIQDGIDRALPDRVNHLSVRSQQSGGPITRVLITSFSDEMPTEWYLYDVASKQLTQIARSSPTAPKANSRTEFYRYSARDGLKIPARLTIPSGASASAKLPLVVLHYGGPWVRAIRFGYDPVVQFLASRGYAVLMPAPRGSQSWGYKHYRAGWKQWGLGMQDDVTDGVNDLIARGVVDPKRVALMGASYGGYLTMMGLVKEPSLFKCGINYVGVTDPAFMTTVTWTDFNEVDSGRYTLPRLIGDPVADAAQFDRTSPLRRAREINQPVLMAYGALDRRVPLVNGEKMRDALSGHNSKVEWVVYPDEGHGWLKDSTKLDFYARVERFLASNL
jgi:dienelactone hydrolase